MSVDVDLSVTISRDALGLEPLEIATDPVYYLSTQFLGAQVTWTRQQIQSQWLDGSVTTARHRGMVTEQVAVEVRGHDLPAVQTSINILIDAFSQDTYTMTVVAGYASRVYRCESADYQDLSWTTPRMAGAQGQVMFSVPRQPLPLSGGH